MSYIPQTKIEKEEMLKQIGVSSTGALFSDIPDKIVNKSGFKLPPPASEIELKGELGKLSRDNLGTDKAVSFLGAGRYNHYIPSVVSHLVSRSEFYTAYTPYQAEMSQGILQAIFEFQSLICRLTGMDVCNASMYDGATSFAEAASLAVRHTGKSKILVSSAAHPNYIEVLKTYAKAASWEIIELPLKSGITETINTDNFAAVMCQHPNFFGCIENLKSLGDFAHNNHALFVVSVDPISLGLLKPPADFNADVVVGEGQSLGSPVSFGGPGLGIFAVKNDLIRLIPGRLVGETVDHDGKRGYVLTLQAREQHIRRDKALSNICTNSALMALAATIYLSFVGKSGLQKVAADCLHKANYLKKRLSSTKGFSLPFFAPTFKEFAINTPLPPEKINKALLDNNIIGGLDLNRFYPNMKNHMLWCATELISKNDIDKAINIITRLL